MRAILISLLLIPAAIGCGESVEAHNDIIWKYKDSLAWDAVLAHKNGTTIYNMRSFDPFKK